MCVKLNINISELYEKIKLKRDEFHKKYIFFDKIEHLVLCFLICLFFGWKIASAVGLTIEGTQLESGFPLSYDNFVDLGADGMGIILAVMLSQVFKKSGG